MTYDHWKTMSDRDARDSVDPEKHSICPCGYLAEICGIDPECPYHTPFACPRCGWTSYNCHDARELYCGHCHAFVDDEADTNDLRQRQ
jgi:hypothetical protein